MRAIDNRIRGAVIAALLMLLAACASTRPPVLAVPAGMSWDQRVERLQEQSSWTLAGRAAVAVGSQGWQANLNWQQRSLESDLHLSGPLGVGAQILKLTPAGLSINGAPADGAALAQLEDKLGFDLPISRLRYWLLGVPDPAAPDEVVRDSQDCAQQLTQDGWSIAYERYAVDDGNLLPARLVLTRDDVRVRIIVDHWNLNP
jgi:outer membrane lipoprotein LolB